MIKLQKSLQILTILIFSITFTKSSELETITRAPHHLAKVVCYGGDMAFDFHVSGKFTSKRQSVLKDTD